MMKPYTVLPKRQSTKIKDYDYSTAGAYFVTVCTRDRMPFLSEIVRTDATAVDGTLHISVGEGLAPPAVPACAVHLKPCGKIAAEQLLLLESRYPTVTIDAFIIMPDHIHAIIVIHKNPECAAPSLNQIIGAFKSLTTRICHRQYGIETIFQRSYADHIIRNREDYETRRKYLYENPVRWYYKHLENK